jgi:hypothetical protein
MNPKLYTEAASAMFHDITQGNNDVSNLGAYFAKPGYDACTGLGTPDGAKILAALQMPAAAFNAVDTQTTRPTGIPAVHN